jgi:protein TonB
VIDLESAPPPPPPPPPAPTQERAEPSLPATSAPHRAPAAAKAAPAEAGKTLNAADDAVADFTMVQGAGAYAGGVTSSTGKSKNAVASAASSAPPATSVAGDAGPAAGSGKPARPLGGDWDCKALFPSGATHDTATVVLVARVRPDGRAESVSVVTDPGEGFGRAAKTCAMQQTYAPAQDKEGRAIAAATAPFRVRFTR